MPASPARTALVGVLGLGLGGAGGLFLGWWTWAGAEVEPVAPARAEARPRPPPAAPPAPSERPPQPATPDDMNVLLRANQLGCDCPLPPPDDLDPSYLPEAVEAWLDDLAGRCAVLASREVALDCSEWPCLLSVELGDREEWMRKDLVAYLTCGDTAGPNLVPKGNVGSSADDMSHLFSVRPAEHREFNHRELLRMSDLMIPAPRPSAGD